MPAPAGLIRIAMRRKGVRKEDISFINVPLKFYYPGVAICPHFKHWHFRKVVAFFGSTAIPEVD